METFVFTLIITIYVLMTLLSFITQTLDYKARDREIPDNVKDVYDPETYQKWRDYSAAQTRFGVISKLIRFLALFILLVSGALSWWANLTMEVSDNVYLSTLLFIGALVGAQFVFATIRNYLYTFELEERYGFNTTTIKTFVRDTFIGLVLMTALGGGILMLLLFIFETFGGLFIVIASIAVFAIFLLINVGYVKIILPLFNTLSPLEDGELKVAIETLAKQENYTVKKIHTMDASKRSTKLNAFFSGFGRFKNVVLFDTLLEKMNTPEILAVLAHEIGHAKHKDVLKNIVMGALNLIVTFALLYGFFMIDIFYEAFNLDAFHFGFMLIIFSITLSPLSLLFGMLTNHLSRKAEFKADAYAASVTSGDSMADALKVLARENFSNLTPHELNGRLRRKRHQRRFDGGGAQGARPRKLLQPDAS